MSKYYVPMPNILKENHAGASVRTCQDELFEQRTIHLTGDIDMALAGNIIDQLYYLERQDADLPVIMRISSPGGEVTAGLAIYDAMRDVSCPVQTVCEGMAASMAAVLFTAGNWRVMMPHAELKIHDPLIQNTGGSAMAIQRSAERIMYLRRQTSQIMADHTGKTLEEIYQLTQSDYYMSADEAIKLGFADVVRIPDKPRHIPCDNLSEPEQKDSNVTYFTDKDMEKIAADAKTESEEYDYDNEIPDPDTDFDFEELPFE